MASATDKLIKRLSVYWKLEAANVVLIPGTLILFSEGNIGWMSFLTFLPMMLLLAIGAVYWRAKLRAITDPKSDMWLEMRLISPLQIPSLILTVIAVPVAVYAWVNPSASAGLWDRGCATFAAILAVLEYINYYHRQIQHFDNLPDFKRLLAGKGFRRSQMSKDLAAYRAAER